MKQLPLLLISTFIVTALPVFSNAKTAEEVLASADTPQAKGLAIAVEGDRRDLGFGDFQVEVEMLLHNAYGDSSKREMRNKTFEIQDAGLGDKSMIIFDRPADVKGTAFLTHSKILEPDDQWLYLPSLKRVKRIASKNKSGPFVGSEFAYEDIASNEVEKFSYNYLKTEPCGDLQCFVVERFPEYEYSGYTRQLVWVDTQEFRPVKIDFYDRKDSLLKTLTYKGYKQYLGKYWRADRFEMVNHQTGKRTELFWKNYAFRTGLDESYFVKAKLKQIR